MDNNDRSRSLCLLRKNLCDEFLHLRERVAGGGFFVCVDGRCDEYGGEEDEAGDEKQDGAELHIDCLLEFQDEF